MTVNLCLNLCCLLIPSVDVAFLSHCAADTPHSAACLDEDGMLGVQTSLQPARNPVLLGDYPSLSVLPCLSLPSWHRN